MSNVYVFPSTGQSATQQSKDESACCNWAVQNTGTDPLQVANQEAQQQQQTAQQMQQAQDAGKGTAVKGTVGGAAKSRNQQQEATQQAQQQGQAASQALAGQLDNFKKAFSVCLEAKKYMVKY